MLLTTFIDDLQTSTLTALHNHAMLIPCNSRPLGVLTRHASRQTKFTGYIVSAKNFLVLRRVRRVGSTGRPNATLGTPGARLILQKQMGGVRSDGERWGAAWSDLTIMYDIQIAIIVVLKFDCDSN